jgi:hypothetical protein
MRDTDADSLVWTTDLSLRKLQSLALSGAVKMRQRSRNGNAVVLVVIDAPHIEVGRSPRTNSPDSDLEDIRRVLRGFGVVFKVL